MNYLELQFDALQRHKPGGPSRVKRLSNRDHDEVKQMMFDKFVKARNYFFILGIIFLLKSLKIIILLGKLFYQK